MRSSSSSRFSTWRTPIPTSPRCKRKFRWNTKTD
jgi:hypothetical protein